MKPERIVELHEDLGEEFPGKVEFVRADHYFNLYNQANHLPFSLVMSPKTSIKAGDPAAGLDLVADGTPATLWTSSETGKQWIEFDFGEAYQIGRYVIRHAGASGMSRGLNTRNFMVQARAESEPWTTIDVVRDNTGDVTDVEVDPVSARYIKITVTDAGADSTARIAEVEVFGRNAQR